MPKAKLRMPSGSLIDTEIRRIVTDLDEGPIEASLLVDGGHDYWWHLEFGTATGYMSPPADNPFIQPASTLSHEHQDGWYTIAPTAKRLTTRRQRVRSTKTGRLTKRTKNVTFYKPLVFKDVTGWSKSRGREITTGRFKRVWNRKWQWQIATEVEHPGITPRAYFRQALNRITIRSWRQLSKLAAKDQLPEREDIVDIINDELARALYELKSVLKETESLRNWPRPQGRLWKALSIDPAE